MATQSVTNCKGFITLATGKKSIDVTKQGILKGEVSLYH
jgi:hypothetical protein